MTRIVVLLLLLLVPAAALADIVILIPTLYSGPGAFGSMWFSFMVVTNHSDQPFQSELPIFHVQCPIPEGCVSARLDPGNIGFLGRARPANGLLLYVPEAIANDLAFTGRFGAGGNVETIGTEMPIVRQHEFRQTPIHFPYVSLHNTLVPVRTYLRVYSPDLVPARVRVEVRPFHLPEIATPTASKEITLDVPNQLGAPRPIFPAFAQLWMQNEFPHDLLLGSLFHITVVPLPSESGEVPRVWALLSTTENTTQRVALHTPQ